MKKLILLSTMLFFVCCLFAQERNITGTVVDANGTPLKNVQLSILYTRINIKTDKNGQFTLKRVQPTDSIRVIINKKNVASFEIGENNNLKLTIIDNLLQVNTEAGTMAAVPFAPLLRDRTLDTVITDKMIERNGFNSLVDAIKNMMPFISFSSDENGEMYASMRGKNSLTLSSASTVYLDGVETPFSDVNNTLNVWDVKRIEAHKNGDGYGLKGSNGVIVITTKQ